MRAILNTLFGRVPDNAENLEIVGAFPQRFEEWSEVTAWPGSGVLRRRDRTIETETIWIEKHLELCGDYHSKWSRFPKRQRGRFFNLSLFWWQNYYHWICDVLPRLQRTLGRLEPDVRIILPPGLTAWQKRSLELIGLPLDRCVTYSGKRPWKVERLLYASPVAMTGDHEPKSLCWTRDTIRQELGCMPAKPGWRKLYLSRKNAPSRRIVNEDELFPLLKQRGFEVVDSGALSFDAQVRLFSEAQCVIGAHGAAFTNILWSQAGLKALEIFEPGSVRRCYWSMCRVLGHVHACVVGDSVSNGHAEPNLSVNLDSFESALNSICNQL